MLVRRRPVRWTHYGASIPLALRPLLRPIWLLIVITILGAVGYSVLLELEPIDALYQSVITLSTVGFTEVVPFDRYTKGFTIVLILLGVGTVFYLITMFAASLFDGEVRRTLEHNIMLREVRAMREHFVICGFGRVGEEVAQQFHERKREFIVVDNDRTSIDRALSLGYHTVEGNAAQDDVLREVGIARASRLIASTGSDEVNTYTVLTAKSINPNIIIVTRSESPMAAEKLELAGADRIVSPYAIGGRRMALAALHPMMTDFMDVLSRGRLGKTMMAEFNVEAGSELDGKPLMEAFATSSATVLGIQKASGEVIVGPKGSQVLHVGDLVIVLAEEDSAQPLAKA